MLSGIAQSALDGEPLEVVGTQIVQASICLYSVALNRGSWVQRNLSLEEVDPRAVDALSGTVHEVEDYYRYQKAYKTWLHKTSTSLKSSGSEVAPAMATQTEKKKKRMRSPVTKDMPEE